MSGPFTRSQSWRYATIPLWPEFLAGWGYSVRRRTEELTTDCCRDPGSSPVFMASREEAVPDRRGWWVRSLPFGRVPPSPVQPPPPSSASLWRRWSVGGGGGGDQFVRMATLQPQPLPNNPSHPTPADRGSRPSASVPPRVLLFRGTETRLSQLSPFHLQNGCDRFGEVLRCTKLRDGAIEVEFKSGSDAARALKAVNFVYSVKRDGKREDVVVGMTVEPHKTKNFSRGVINCYDLRDISDDEIADGLEKDGVVTARRIMVKRGDQLVPTNNIILTFDRPDIPSTLRVGYVRVQVRPFVPSPMRCFRCHRFGHTQLHCKRRPACGKCSSEDHTRDECQSETVWCVNCGDGQIPHPAYAKGCPALAKEKEILSIMSTRKVSFREAREIYESSHPKVTYADAAKSHPTPPARAEQLTLAQFVAMLHSFGLKCVPMSGASEMEVVPTPTPAVAASDAAVRAAVPIRPPPKETAVTNTSDEGGDWTVVQPRHSTGRPATTPSKTPSAETTAVPPPSSRASPVEGRGQGALNPPRMGPPPLPPPPPPPPRKHSGRTSAPLPVVVPGPGPPPTTPPTVSRPVEEPLAPGRPTKRTHPWEISPTEGGSPRTRHRFQPGATGRASSVDGRLNFEHPRISFGESPGTGGDERL